MTDLKKIFSVFIIIVQNDFTQLTFTCSKANNRNIKKMCEIC